MQGKQIVLGVTGGIAAYKAAELLRLLVKEGATVHVVMSAGAEAFITPLTLQTLSGHPVGRNLLDLTEESQIGHIALADRADLIVIAPATANSIARMAAGMADELLTAVVLASKAPVLLAPAMNVNMWENPLTQQNLNRLIGTGRFSTAGPDQGDLACGWVGAGRLMEPLEILRVARAALAVPAAGAKKKSPPGVAVDPASAPLRGRAVVVTAGPTREPVDAVRYLGNRSSGKMGFALAEVAARLGAKVTLIAGPVALPTPPGVARRIDVESTQELQSAVERAAAGADAVVMAAAPADFRAANPVPGKLSRRTAKPGQPLSLTLAANPDILAGLGRARTGAGPLLVGFAAEVGLSEQALREKASAKLREKGIDAVVGNDVGTPGIGFGSDDNAGVLVLADGKTVRLPRASKLSFAEQIWAELAPRLPRARK